MRSAAARRGRTALAAALLVVLAAGGGAAARADRPAEVLLPDLSSAQPQLRRQIAEAMAEADRRLAAGAPAGELAAAYGELGLVLIGYQVFDPALTAFANAHALAPDEVRWTYLLGCVHRWLGHPDEALALLERSLEMRPEYVPALVRVGRLRLEAGDPAAARQRFARALELAPDTAAAWEGLGRTAAAEGDHARAAAHFRRALELAPEADSLHYRLGLALRHTGDLAAAQAALARSGDAAVALRDPLLQDLARAAENVQLHLLRGGEAMQDGRYEEAAAAFERAVAVEPESYRALSGLGWALRELGDLDGAEAHLRRAVGAATEPLQVAEGAAALADVLLAAGRDGDAAAVLRRSLEARPEQPAVRRRLADALARLGRFEDALAEYDRLLAAAPGDLGLLVPHATVLVNLGRGEEAVAELRRVVEEQPAEAAPRLRLAEVLEHLGRHDEAGRERQALRAAGQDEQRAAVLVHEGGALATRGEHEAAVEAFRQALELAPELHEVRLARASLLGRLGRYEAAAAEFARVAAADPDQATARRGEIASLLLAGRYGPARVRLNAALSRFSRDRELALTQARLLAAAPDERVRDGALALEVARRVRAVDDGLLARETLAMALAEAGRWEEAVEVQTAIVEEARRRGAEPLAAQQAERLAAYRARRAWRAAQPGEILAYRLGG